jgi:hypothetical protein
MKYFSAAATSRHQKSLANRQGVRVCAHKKTFLAGLTGPVLKGHLLWIKYHNLLWLSSIFPDKRQNIVALKT